MRIPLPLLYALAPVLLTGMIYFTAWVVRQLVRHSELLEKAGTKIEGHDDRIKRLEGWQDGVQFGRAVAQAEQQRS